MASVDVVGIDLRYDNVTLCITLPPGKPSQLPTVPEQLLSIALAPPAALLRRIQGSTPANTGSKVLLLDSISGSIQPGRMTLLLGAPGR